MSPTIFLDGRPTRSRAPAPPVPGPYRRPRPHQTAKVAAALALLGLTGGGIWWHQAVTANPGLEFGAAVLNVFRPDGSKAGIIDTRNSAGSESTVEYSPGGRFSAFMTLENHGPRDVRIEVIPDQGFGQWGLDEVVVSDNVGLDFADGAHPLEPFTLGAGDHANLRLDFRFADCGPLATFNNGYSLIEGLPVKYKGAGLRPDGARSVHRCGTNRADHSAGMRAPHRGAVRLLRADREAAHQANRAMASYPTSRAVQPLI